MYQENAEKDTAFLIMEISFEEQKILVAEWIEGGPLDDEERLHFHGSPEGVTYLDEWIPDEDKNWWDFLFEQMTDEEFNKCVRRVVFLRGYEPDDLDEHDDILKKWIKLTNTAPANVWWRALCEMLYERKKDG